MDRDMMGSLDKARAARMKVGSYTGTGIAMSEPITGVGFKPRVVLIMRNTNLQDMNYFLTTELQTDQTWYVDFIANKIAYAGSVIETLDADGFTVTDIANVVAVVYTYIAWR